MVDEGSFPFDLCSFFRGILYQLHYVADWSIQCNCYDFFKFLPCSSAQSYTVPLSVMRGAVDVLKKKKKKENDVQ